jgi:hypothetical protein
MGPLARIVAARREAEQKAGDAERALNHARKLYCAGCGPLPSDEAIAAVKHFRYLADQLRLDERRLLRPARIGRRRAPAW